MKWVYKILMSLAVFTVLGHGMITHHHSEDIPLAHHDDDQDSDHHSDNNLFSFKYLDHFYSPHSSVSVPIDQDHLYVLPVQFHSEILVENIKPWRYIVRNEYPPPLTLHYKFLIGVQRVEDGLSTYVG